MELAEIENEAPLSTVIDPWPPSVPPASARPPAIVAAALSVKVPPLDMFSVTSEALPATVIEPAEIERISPAPLVMLLTASAEPAAVGDCDFGRNYDVIRRSWDGIAAPIGRGVPVGRAGCSGPGYRQQQPLFERFESDASGERVPSFTAILS